jgi:O-antigen/teichoic acid export membrane protein
LPQIYALIQSVIAARILGPEGMGQQSFIAWVQISLTFLMTGGLPIAIMRYVGESVGAGRKGAVAHLLNRGWQIEALGAVAGATILIIVATGRGELRSAWILAGIACAMSIMHTVPNAVLIGLQRFREASIVGLVLGAAGTGAVVLVLLNGGGIVGMFAVEVFVSAAAMGWAGYLARRALPERDPRSPQQRELDRRVLRYAGLASIRVLFAVIVWRRSELFFLERYSSVEEIAFYSVAFSAFAALSELPSALLATLFPAFATLYGAGQIDRIRSGFGRTLRLLIVITLPILTAVLIVGPRALTLLYGVNYTRTGGILRILLCAFPFYVLFKLGGALLQGMDLLPKMFPVDIVAMIVNFGVAIWLIPQHGAIGAAGANATAQVVGGTLLLTIAVRRVGDVSWDLPILARTVLACAAVAVAMAAGMLLEGMLGLSTAVVGGAGVYLLIAGRLGVIGWADARWLDATVGDRFGGLVGRAARLLASDRSEGP